MIHLRSNDIKYSQLGPNEHLDVKELNQILSFIKNM